MKLNKAGVDLIKQWEGCRLKAYQDIVGVWTIGFGATGADVRPGMVWTQEQADKRLAADLERFSENVKEYLRIELSDNQFSALVSFAYNLGTFNLKKSTLLKFVNEGKFRDAAGEFARWNRAGGVVVEGLRRRRQAEKELFLS